MTRRKKPKRHAIRAAVVGVLFMLWLALVGARAGYLQLYQGTWLSDKAAGQYEQKLSLHGKRGTIYDRNHQAMAVSIETTSVAANPALFNGLDKHKAAIDIAKALHLKTSDIKARLNAKRSFVWLKRQATPKEVAAVKALNFKGIDYLSEHARFYPNTTLAAQVLGFVGIDGHGLEGLEFYYDDELKGQDQKFTLLKDALGRRFDADSHLAADNREGKNLILTLDSHIQYITEQALADAVTQYKALSGMAVVMDPRSGAILALANYPFFNPNSFNKYHRDVWRNRAITDTFEPGSTMKVFSTAAALQHHVATPSTIFFCENGLYTVGGHQIHDTKSHGWLSVQQIVKFSSNIGTVKLAQKLGRQTLFDQLKEFGFGAPTLIDCPGETAGSLSHYKRWTSVDTGNIAFGQGIAVTALQLISAAAALANDGWMMQPHILAAICDADGAPVHTVAPKALRQVVSTDTAATMRRIMRTVITEGGTGVQADVDGYSVCGKTGTAQKLARNGGYANDRYIASFLGLVPTQRPALAILVVVDEPKVINYGGTVAAPAFRQIAKETLGYLNIMPDKVRKKYHVSSDGNVSG